MVQQNSNRSEATRLAGTQIYGLPELKPAELRFNRTGMIRRNSRWNSDRRNSTLFAGTQIIGTQVAGTQLDVEELISRELKTKKACQNSTLTGRRTQVYLTVPSPSIDPSGSAEAISSIWSRDSFCSSSELELTYTVFFCCNPK